MDYIYLIIGLALLVVSGDFLVKAAVNLALKIKISPLVVGMTVVSFGTSAPELLISIQAALTNHPEIAIGNVVGSNIANLALVLGVTVLIFPMPVARNTIVFNWPMMIFSSLLLYLFILNNMISKMEGGIMFLLLSIFITFLIINSRKNEKIVTSKDEPPVKIPLIYWVKDIGIIAISCGGLAFGSSLLLEGAVNIASTFGVSEYVIGVTVVAFGTSVPELVTSVVAAFRRETDISVGNLIGSNIFNIMAILGITGMIVDIPVNDNVITNDIFWVLASAFIIFPFMIFGQKITRFAGFLLLSLYVLYIYFLIYPY
jgi:cation:H+ antiporter